MIDYQKALVGKFVMPHPDATLVITGDDFPELRRCLAAAVRHGALRVTTFADGEVRETDFSVTDADEREMPDLSDFIVKEDLDIE